MRFIGIDILRGIAVTLVLFRHFDFIEVLSKFGWAGVDLFFVLSGFLVSGLLFKEYHKFGNIKPGLFLIRRGFKIYPLFYFLIAVTSLKALLVHLLNLSGNLNYSYKTLLSELLFVQNYFARIWSHTWSLAVEEHFYILVTFLIFILIKRKQLENRKLFNAISFLIFATSLLLRIYNAYFYKFSYDTHLFPSHYRFDSLFWGVFLAYNYYFNTEVFKMFFKRNLLLLRIIAVLAILPGLIWYVENFFMNTFGLTLLYLGFGIVLIDVFFHEHYFKKTNNLIKPLIKSISFIGFYSYSIYLWHIPVKIYIFKIFMSHLNITLPSSIQFMIYLGLCVSVGYIISRIIEIPLLKYRNSHFIKRTS